MNNIENKSNTIQNIMWRFGERFGAKFVSFLVSLVLARILSPDEYGIVALVTVFTNLFSVFVECGLGMALIQKKDADELDFSTVFYFNMLLCFLTYIIMFLAAPLIANFYMKPELVSVIRVQSITLIISGFMAIPSAYISKNLLFKKFFYATLFGTIFSAFVGIGMAYTGFGYWSLVGQQLTNMFFDTLILWIIIDWKPKPIFSFLRLKTLLNYGYKLLLSTLLDRLYTNMKSLIIGKVYTTSDLAYYNKGEEYPQLLMSNLSMPIDNVIFPIMAKQQDNKDNLLSLARRSLKVSMYIICPMMMGLAGVSISFVKLLLTDKWLPAIPFMIIACFVFSLFPIHTMHLNVINALGRSDIFLKLEIIKKIVGITAILISIRYGVLAIACSSIVTGLIGTFINGYPSTKLINYSYKQQLSDILPTLCLSMFMGIIVFQFNRLGLSTISTLLIQILVGILIYWTSSKILHLEAYDYLVNTAIQFLNKKNK